MVHESVFCGQRLNPPLDNRLLCNHHGQTESNDPTSFLTRRIKRGELRRGQRLAKQKAYEKQAKRKKIKLAELTIFTSSWQCSRPACPWYPHLRPGKNRPRNPVFRVIVRNVRNESLRPLLFKSCGDYPNAFPSLVSMVEAGEASATSPKSSKKRPRTLTTWSNSCVR